MKDKEPSTRYWVMWYSLVAGWLLATILFFYWLTRYFN